MKPSSNKLLTPTQTPTSDSSFGGIGTIINLLSTLCKGSETITNVSFLYFSLAKIRFIVNIYANVFLIEFS